MTWRTLQSFDALRGVPLSGQHVRLLKLRWARLRRGIARVRCGCVYVQLIASEQQSGAGGQQRRCMLRPGVDVERGGERIRLPIGCIGRGRNHG